MRIITRQEWGAQEPRRRRRMAKRRDRIFAHWLGNAYPKTLSDEEILRRVQKYHKNSKGWSDIAYSWAIGRTGRAFECRGMSVAGGHTKTENDDSYGIVFLIGEGEEPTEEMWQTFTDLVEYIRVNDPLWQGSVDGRIFGHRHDDEASTECPGDTLAAKALAYKHSRDYRGGSASERELASLRKQLASCREKTSLVVRALEELTAILDPPEANKAG